MNINSPAHEPASTVNQFEDVILGVMTNDEFEERILDTKNYKTASVRDIIFDDEHKVGIIYSAKENYYKLPGGGIEEGESNERAGEREGMEEAGVELSIEKYIGTIVEQSATGKVIQNNRGYIAKVIGKKGKTELTEEEIERKFELHWMDIDVAIDLMQKNIPTSYRGNFMQKRDLWFLQEAKKHI